MPKLSDRQFKGTMCLCSLPANNLRTSTAVFNDGNLVGNTSYLAYSDCLFISKCELASLLCDLLAAMAMVIRDLAASDVILLITPIVLSINPTDKLDPFEILGRALALRHSKVRHSPYSETDGISGTHQALMGIARLLIFVINYAQQIEVARTI